MQIEKKESFASLCFKCGIYESRTQTQKPSAPFRLSKPVYISVKAKEKIRGGDLKSNVKNEYKPRLELPLTTVIVLSKLLSGVSTCSSESSST